MPAHNFFDQVPAPIWGVVVTLILGYYGYRQKQQEIRQKDQEQKFNQAKEEYDRGQNRIVQCQDRMDELDKKLNEERDRYEKLYKEHLEECRIRSEIEVKLANTERQLQTQQISYEQRISEMQRRLDESSTTIANLTAKNETLHEVIAERQVVQSKEKPAQ